MTAATFNPDKRTESIRVMCTASQKRRWTIFAHGELSDIVRESLEKAYRRRIVRESLEKAYLHRLREEDSR